MDTRLASRQFKKGDNLFTEGEVGSDAYLITAGRVAIWSMRNGSRVHLALRDEGTVVGEMALLDDTVRSATATAETDVTVDVLTRPVLRFLLSKVPEPLETILHQLMEALRCSNDMIGMYAARPADVDPSTGDVQKP